MKFKSSLNIWRALLFVFVLLNAIVACKAMLNQIPAPFWFVMYNKSHAPIMYINNKNVTPCVVMVLLTCSVYALITQQWPEPAGSTVASAACKVRDTFISVIVPLKWPLLSPISVRVLKGKTEFRGSSWLVRRAVALAKSFPTRAAAALDTLTLPTSHRRLDALELCPKRSDTQPWTYETCCRDFDATWTCIYHIFSIYRRVRCESTVILTLTIFCSWPLWDCPFISINLASTM